MAGPGEPLEIRLRPCDELPGLPPTGGDHVVTIVFTAPSGASRVVALANDCLGVITNDRGRFSSKRGAPAP